MATEQPLTKNKNKKHNMTWFSETAVNLQYRLIVAYFKYMYINTVHLESEGTQKQKKQQPSLSVMISTKPILPKFRITLWSIKPY